MFNKKKFAEWILEEVPISFESALLLSKMMDAVFEKYKDGNFPKVIARRPTNDDIRDYLDMTVGDYLAYLLKMGRNRFWSDECDGDQVGWATGIADMLYELRLYPNNNPEYTPYLLQFLEPENL